MTKSNIGAITCRAAVCWAAGEELTVEEIEVAPPLTGEVRVRMMCATTCHTDVIFAAGFPPYNFFPRVLGHEGAGIVESIGEGVEDLNVGDLVIPLMKSECGECRRCLSGKTNFCSQHPLQWSGLMDDGTTRMTSTSRERGRVPIFHMFTCSTFSEFTVAAARNLLKIHDDHLIGHPEEAGLLACGFSTGFGMVWKEAAVADGDAVAVFGLGGVGLGAIAGARCLEARKIIGVDVNEKRREKAEVFGMTDFINPRDLLSGDGGGTSLSDAIKEITGGEGVDCSCDCCGVPSVIDQAILATITGGGVTVIAGIGNDTGIPLSTLTLIGGNRSVKGTIFGGIRARSDIPELVAKCRNKGVILGEMITHKLAFEEINQAFQLLKQPDCIKVVVEMDKQK